MGYYATYEKSCPVKPDLLSKNCVWDFSASSLFRTRQNPSKPLETTSETSVTITTTVSGLPFWPSRDPIEEEGGINIYGFVQNDPVSNIDPTGLATYSCLFKYLSGGSILGGGYLWGDCTSQCDDNNTKYHDFKVKVLLGGLTVGFLPAGTTAFNIVLHTDNLTNEPNDLQGSASLTSLGVALIVGVSISEMKLGDSYTADLGGSESSVGGEQFGIDAPNIDYFFGYSLVPDKSIKEMCCPE